MKIIIEVAMTSGKKHRIDREHKTVDIDVVEAGKYFEKELEDNLFITCSSGARLRCSNIESYNIILGSTD